MGIRVSNIAKAERVHVLIPAEFPLRPRRVEATTDGYANGEYYLRLSDGTYVTMHESRVQHATGPHDCPMCSSTRTRIDMTPDGMALVCEGCGRVHAIDGVATY